MLELMMIVPVPCSRIDGRTHVKFERLTATLCESGELVTPGISRVYRPAILQKAMAARPMPDEQPEMRTVSVVMGMFGPVFS